MSATQEAKRIRQNHLLVVGLLVATLTLGRPASSSSLTERPGSPRQHQQQQRQVGQAEESNLSNARLPHHDGSRQDQSNANSDYDRQDEPQLSFAGNASASNRRADEHQKNQQQQQRKLLHREISCAELNLIVLAQASPSLNVNTANRFIECQRVDPGKPAAAAQQLAASLQRASEFNAPGADQPALEAGAKVALLLLSSAALLVVCGTLYDLHRRRLNEAPLQQVAAGGGQLPLQLHSTAGRQARDQRSPSLSSTGSSSLFCSSANSLASASAPILGSHGASRQSALRAKALLARAAAKPAGSSQSRSVLWCLVGRRRRQHYERNIIAGQCSPSASSSSVESVPADGEQPAKRSQEDTLLAAVMQADRWRGRHQKQLTVGCESAVAAACELECEPQSASTAESSLLEQVLLSFSLYHSAATIFGTGASGAKAEPAPAYCCCAELACQLGLGRPSRANQCAGGHRSRLPSLSSIHESCGAAPGRLAEETGSQADTDKEQLEFEPSESQRTFCCASLSKANTVSSQPEDKQSIDSLHGLRFLSMIWIIVVHSYTLATRWSFFTNNAALDNIYKTAASQLLSNGTFACDSFFFTGGFLLAYLAFPDASTSQKREQFSSSSSSLSATGKPGAAAKCRCRCRRSGCSSPDSSRRQPVAGGQEPDSVSQRSSASGCDVRQCHACPASGAISTTSQPKLNEFTFNRVLENLLHRYVRMMPLMMAVIGLSVTSLRFLGEGPAWDSSTMMFDKWCRKNWWINALFLHNFVNRENMCLSHSWYSAVDIQLFLVGQLILLALYKSKPLGLLICSALLLLAPLLTGALTLLHHLPAVPLMISSVSEQSLSLYYGEIYIKPYCRAAPYLIGILLAYLMRTTSLGQARLKRWQVALGWSASLSCLLAILLATQPAMNGQAPGEFASALYSALSRPLWALATGWMIFACVTKQGGPVAALLGARCFVPLSRLTYPAFLIHPIVMAVFYGSRQENFSHYLMLYLTLGHIVITYVLAFILSALFELPILSAERAIKRARRAVTK